jgi:hypothetical protein
MGNPSLKRLSRRDPTFDGGGSPPDFEESAPVPDEREADAGPVLGDLNPVSQEREDSDAVLDAKETDVAEESPMTNQTTTFLKLINPSISLDPTSLSQ